MAYVKAVKSRLHPVLQAAHAPPTLMALTWVLEGKLAKNRITMSMRFRVMSRGNEHRTELFVQYERVLDSPSTLPTLAIQAVVTFLLNANMLWLFTFLYLI